MASEGIRSAHARELAEEALVLLALAVGSRMQELVVIGGLNPGILVDRPPVPHLGTTDVDVLLEVGFVFDRDDMDFAWLETGLRSAGFAPRLPGQDCWRWYVVIDGLQVKVELLCDAPEPPGQELALPGCTDAVAQNLRGPRPALLDSVERDLEIPASVRFAHPSAPDTIRVRFAGLGGYAMAKAAAAVSRGLDKDFYDLAYVLLFNTDGGPEGAAHAIRRVMQGDPVIALNSQINIALDILSDETSSAPHAYAEQMRLAGDAAPVAVLVQDAIGAALLCRRVLAEQGS